MTREEFCALWPDAYQVMASAEGWYMHITLGLILHPATGLYKEVQRKAEAGSEIHQRALALHAQIRVTG